MGSAVPDRCAAGRWKFRLRQRLPDAGISQGLRCVQHLGGGLLAAVSGVYAEAARRLRRVGTRPRAVRRGPHVHSHLGTGRPAGGHAGQHRQPEPGPGAIAGDRGRFRCGIVG